MSHYHKMFRGKRQKAVDYFTNAKGETVRQSWNGGAKTTTITNGVPKSMAGCINIMER